MSMLGVSQRNATRTVRLAITRSVLEVRLSNIGSDTKFVARGKMKMVIVDRSLFMRKRNVDIPLFMVILVVDLMLTEAFLAIAMRTFAVAVRMLAILAVVVRMSAVETLKVLVAAQNMRVLAMERSTLMNWAMSNDTLAVLAVSRAKVFGEERMSLVESNWFLVVSYESLAVEAVFAMEAVFAVDSVLAVDAVFAVDAVRMLAVAMRTLTVAVRAFAVTVRTLAIAMRTLAITVMMLE